ncbi:nitrous oxide reductase accessory protein NosL [Haladaptatus sp. NG-SE-30]
MCSREHGSERHHCASHAHENRADERRRNVLRVGALGIATSLAGCIGNVLQGNGDVPEPVAVGGGLDCDACGMMIKKHPGPNGQIFYESNSPKGHDNPARFDSLKQCFFPFKFEHEQQGWNLVAGYVTDYSSVDYDVSTQGGTTTISSHTEPESFARAKELQYVVDSKVEGAMGPDFIPFSKQSDAKSFADEHGGEVIAFGDIDEGVVGK